MEPSCRNEEIESGAASVTISRQTRGKDCKLHREQPHKTTLSPSPDSLDSKTRPPDLTACV